jgi:hypothetical protein
MGTTSTIEFGPALDGARILFRNFLSRHAPVEGWVREFSADGKLVRISRTRKAKDAGQWFRTFELRCEAVLDEARAPALKEPGERKAPTSTESDGQMELGGEEGGE